MSHCPSCGRYVGPHEACPYCGARLTDRISIRAVKAAAIALATVGLAVLWLFATRTEVPTIAIGRAGATMNLAYVRVAGHCTGVPSYDPETDTLSFWIADETGELRVASYRAETRALIEQGNVPALGDRVSVVGTLRIREDFRSLTIDVPEQLAITRLEPVERAIGSIAPDDEYQRVRVRGQVRELVEPYQGLTVITLQDETGTIDVAVSDELVALSGVAPSVAVGQPVEVRAAVSLYRETPQLVPASAADIAPLDEDVPIAAERFIVELAEGDVGRWVAVRGAVARVDPFSNGVKLTLDDGSGAITVLLWQDVYDGLLDGPEPAVGAQAWAQGQLSQYGGELEVIPELPADVHVLAAAPEPQIMPIGRLTTAEVGQTLTVAGTLSEPQTFSSGIKFALSDPTGTVILLLWQEVYEAIPDGDLLAPGTELEVTGRIDQYRGDIEIIPEAAGVKVME
jgi:DNA/RNA endonuclease YhcR with UshA esterase domain